MLQSPKMIRSGFMVRCTIKEVIRGKVASFVEKKKRRKKRTLLLRNEERERRVREAKSRRMLCFRNE